MKRQNMGMIGAPIQIWGEADKLHVERHVGKLSKCPLDCGIDIFGTKISNVASIGQSQSLLSISTDLHMNPAAGCFLMLTARSSSITSLEGGQVITGIIDAGYQGELIVRVLCPVFDLTTVRVAIESCIAGRIALAQAIPVVFAVPQFMPKQSPNIIMPGRGGNGFGSTNLP